MARTKFSSPTLMLRITEEQHALALKSASGGCLIADAIKKQYPDLSSVSVDMATIRVTDKKAGKRYIYLTPPSAQHILLSFDQGWPNATEDVVVRRAVQITPITASTSRRKKREQRLAELEGKQAEGEELSSGEKQALTKLKYELERPAARGPAEAKVSSGHVTVSGGTPRAQGKAHPNLLRGRNRHFGAKIADPGEVFQTAVDEAVAQKLAEEGNGGDED